MTTSTQLNARLKNFLRGWLLALGLKECLIECATLCIKSEVILKYTQVYPFRVKSSSSYEGTKSNPDIYVRKQFLKFITVCRQGKHVQHTVLLYLTLKEFRDIFFSLLNGRLGLMINNNKATTNASQVSIIHLISYFQDSLVLQVWRGELTID